MRTDTALRLKIINFLTEFHVFDDKNSRKAFILNAGLDNFLPELELDGSPQEFVTLLVNRLAAYGTLSDKRDPLVELLKAGSNYVGLEGQQFCISLIDSIKQTSLLPISSPGFLNSERISPTQPLSPGMAPSLPHLFIGREHDIVELRQRLSGQAETTLITTVRGWPGIGKTTLAAAIAHDSELQKTFPDGVLWTALGTSPNVLFELGQWLLALGDDPQQYPHIEERHNRLAAMLRQRKVLLVVDDVWHATDVQPLLVGGHYCRTLLTTREPEVIRALGLPKHAIYRLLELSEKDAIELIRQLAPAAVKQDLCGVQQLVQELEGLPLALRIAGGLLAVEAELGWGVSDLLSELTEGTRLLKEEVPADRMEVSQQTTPTVAALLQKSTDRLDNVTWERFVLLGLFASKPATFDLPAIAVAWNVDDPKPTIRKLVERGLLEPSDGGRFQMHALLTIHAKSMWEEAQE